MVAGMKGLDRAVHDRGVPILVRADILDAGGSDRMIALRLDGGVWSHAYPGVYIWGPRNGGWHERLGLAVAAAGPGALVSHRAAFVLWGLDGIASELVELTVPYECAPVPSEVILHRTRREMPGEVRRGLPVVGVDRTLLDVAAQVPGTILAKGMNSALRMDLTTTGRLWQTLSQHGGRGVRGSGLFRRVLSTVTEIGATGSPAETEALEAMRGADVPDPVLQWEVVTPSGRRYLVDFGWPDLGKGVEIDGLDAHSGADNLERDLIRQNDLLDTGIQLRRFTARAVRRSPTEVAAAIRRFLLT